METRNSDDVRKRSRLLTLNKDPLANGDLSCSTLDIAPFCFFLFSAVLLGRVSRWRAGRKYRTHAPLRLVGVGPGCISPDWARVCPPPILRAVVYPRVGPVRHFPDRVDVVAPRFLGDLIFFLGRRLPSEVPSCTGDRSRTPMKRRFEQESRPRTGLSPTGTQDAPRGIFAPVSQFSEVRKALRHGTPEATTDRAPNPERLVRAPRPDGKGRGFFAEFFPGSFFSRENKSGGSKPENKKNESSWVFLVFLSSSSGGTWGPRFHLPRFLIAYQPHGRSRGKTRVKGKDEGFSLLPPSSFPFHPQQPSPLPSSSPTSALLLQKRARGGRARKPPFPHLAKGGQAITFPLVR